MPSTLIVYLRRLLARALQVGPYRPDYLRAEAEAAAEARAFYAWRQDPRAFINGMKNTEEVVRWLCEQIDRSMDEWPRVRSEFYELVRGLEQSRFSEELAPLIKDLKDYRQDPLHRRNPLHNRASGA